MSRLLVMGSARRLRCLRALDKHKQYVVSLGSALMVVVVWLSLFPGTQLEVYVSLFAVCYFAVSALFRPRRRIFDVVGGGLFLSFCYIVAVKVIGILVK